MKKVKNNEKIEVIGVTFNGVVDLNYHAIKHLPKDGVYVGCDVKLYPCFDSDDYASEDRFYTNFVFGSSQEEVDSKLATLKAWSEPTCNYNKLTERLHPMAYWGGDTYNDVCLTEGTGEDL